MTKSITCNPNDICLKRKITQKIPPEGQDCFPFSWVSFLSGRSIWRMWALPATVNSLYSTLKLDKWYAGNQQTLTLRHIKIIGPPGTLNGVFSTHAWLLCNVNCPGENISLSSAHLQNAETFNVKKHIYILKSHLLTSPPAYISLLRTGKLLSLQWWM